MLTVANIIATIAAYLATAKPADINAFAVSLLTDAQLADLDDYVVNVAREIGDTRAISSASEAYAAAEHDSLRSYLRHRRVGLTHEMTRNVRVCVYLHALIRAEMSARRIAATAV